MRSDSFHNRLGIVVFLLGLSTLFVFYRLISLQFNLKAAEVAVGGPGNFQMVRPPRGRIFDRNGELLATNAVFYEVGIDYDSVLYGDENEDGNIDEFDRRIALKNIAMELSSLIDMSYESLQKLVLDDMSVDGTQLSYKKLKAYLEPELAPDLERQMQQLYDGDHGPKITPEFAEQISLILNGDYDERVEPILGVQLQRLVEAYGQDLDLELRQHIWALLSGKYGHTLRSITVRPVLLRTYPNGPLAGHILGLVLYNQTGYYGVEGYYDDILGGDTERVFVSIIPLDVGTELQTDANADVYLTIDREIQFLAEQVLTESIQEYEAESGMMLVGDPTTGDILAIASVPGFDPNDIEAVITDTENVGRNPAVSEQFEPGSVFKVITMAAALESGIFSRYSSYFDTGIFEYGGIVVRNWDLKAHDHQDMTGLLARSLNVGAATLSTTLGPKQYYDHLQAFGIGRLTHVDIQGEETGSLRRPGDPDWHDADLATNSFGQGLAVTGLQMLTAVSAVANDGVIMQPHLLQEIRDGDMVYTAKPKILGNPISREVANTLTDMLTASLQTETSHSKALVDGYKLAGKTGTAQIPMPYGYDTERTMASFIGWGPVDQPRFIIYVKLDAPQTSQWGSSTAAPTFAKMVERLVIHMEIPPEEIRQRLASDR
ncbi:MAG: hypothetical protein CL606_05545 [Anaerolineaceae bacterium]|nr:hypothetical protein [Anaerolineaceae bacterium]